MTVEEKKEYLREQHGIKKEQLPEEFKTAKVDIGFFVSPVKVK